MAAASHGPVSTERSLQPRKKWAFEHDYTSILCLHAPPFRITPQPAIQPFRTSIAKDIRRRSPPTPPPRLPSANAIQHYVVLELG